MAGSATLRVISLVVAVCSSTAEAMVLVVVDPAMIAADLADRLDRAGGVGLDRLDPAGMSSVARAVSCASSFTSLATTAKPLPASPARAASIVAFSASRFVCSAMT